jgi:hypothetical protein
VHQGAVRLRARPGLMTRAGTEVNGRQKTGPNWTTCPSAPLKRHLGTTKARDLSI